MLSFLPVAGECGGQLENSQPLLSTSVGGASDDPLPDWFSAGAEMNDLKPASVRLS